MTTRPAPAAERGAPDVRLSHESYVLDNGLTVIIHEDHALPVVVVNLWYDVGSGVEAPGRTGFAHLFEHLMFMGTERLPGSGFDDLMEQHGGRNNAWTSEDATDYYSVGPPNLLPTFLWMEADRMDGLGRAMTQDKLDLQRDVVRNERRQGVEDTPYGILWESIPALMFPAGHPYAHSVIGSHEDLAAATVDDVTRFFDTWYVPNNASLVVAGDVDPAEVRALVQQTLGRVAVGALPDRPTPERADLPAGDAPIVELRDRVQVPMSMMVWHSPAAFQPGDADLDLLSAVLGNGRSSRLYQRLVHADQSALEVDALQMSQALGSLFAISVKPAPGHTLDEVEAAITEELLRIAAEGPTAEELDRARSQYAYTFVRGLEGLRERASALNRYQMAVGEPDYAQKDLARYSAANAASVQAEAALLTPERRLIIRVLPADADATPATTGDSK